MSFGRSRMERELRFSGRRSDFGHHFITGLSGVELDDLDRKILSEARPLGLLLLARNFAEGGGWLDRLDRLLAEARRYSGREKMLVSLDHEGGQFVRTPEPITRFPFAADFAARAGEVAEATAREIARLGVNLSWAPVADVDSNPANPVIGRRSFGRDPAMVAQAACAYAAGLERGGVLGCAKHFPGHGDTSTDSHLELPYLELDLEELSRRELVPFQALAKANVPFFMTAHISFPKIDPENPATMSRTILQGILRERWGYQGVVVADDLGMRAVSDEFRKPAGAVAALEASCDMFIVARSPDPAADDYTLPVADFLIEAREQGRLSDEILRRSHARILRAFDRLPDNQVGPLDSELLAKHAALAASFGRSA